MVAGDMAPRNRVVLVIDDDEDTLLSIGELLDANGYTTLRAASGSDALTLAAQQPPPDLVLLDWCLPHAPAGEPLVQALRQTLGAELPLVVISGDPQALTEARHANVNDYLPKPFVASDLVDVVDALCP